MQSDGGVSVADVPLSRVIDNRAAVSGKCHSKRQTARTTAVYSLYYHSIFSVTFLESVFRTTYIYA